MPKQLEFKKVKGWGGKRKNAGRPNKSGQQGHIKREKVNFKKPIHITMRIKKGLCQLRNSKALELFRESSAKAKTFGLHVIHFSLQKDHIHLIVEAKDNASLESGMKSLNIRFAKAVRKVIGGEGAIFSGRFHIHVLNTPTEMRRALEYVLLNFAKHEDYIEHVDDFSSGHSFRDWRVLLGDRVTEIMDYPLENPIDDPSLSAPQSWLCQKGWMKAPGLGRRPA